MPAAQTAPLFDMIDTWLNEANAIKAAAAKANAKPAAKPAGATKVAFGDATLGKTKHPSENVDNDTHNAPEGERFRENSEDVKKDIPANVDETPEGAGADEDKVMPNIGTEQAATGEQPSVETSSVKGDKDDDGYDGKTKHPANAEDTGEKYSSMKLAELLKAASDKTNRLMADIANGRFSDALVAPAQAKTASAKPATAPAATPAAPANDLTKEAADNLAADMVAKIYRDAELDADLVGPFALAYLEKYAADEPPPPPEPEGQMPPMPEGGAEAGSMPPDGGEGAPPMPPDAGGPPGAGGPPPDMGGAPPGGPGGDVMSALSQGADQGGGGAVSPQEAIAHLGMALQELGIDPKELAAMSAEHGKEPEEGAKLAAAVVNYKRSGKYQVRECKTAQERKNRDQIKAYVMDITGMAG